MATQKHSFSMDPQAGRSHEDVAISHEVSTRPQFLFVDGPSLNRGADSRSSNTRSVLIRRQLSEKRSKYRQREESKRLELIAQRQERDVYRSVRWCACDGTARGQAPNQVATHGFTVPQTQKSDGTVADICGICGGLRVTHQAYGSNARAPSLSPVNGRADPFSSVDPSLGPCVEDLVQFALKNIWPNFRHTNYSRRCYQSWIVPNRENKLIIYSNLWAGSCHRDVLRISYGSDPVLDIKDQLYYKGRILSLLRQHVTDFTKEEWRDGIILAILYLAVNETERRDLSRDPSPFTPPFMDMQMLSFYGSRDYHTMHWGVIVNLLGQLGGIQSTKLFGVAWLTSISDLMNAAHSLTKPVFPIVEVEGNVTTFLPPLHAFPFPGDPSRQTKLGFRVLLSTHPPVKDAIVDVFLHLSLYSTIVQRRYGQNIEPSDCDRLADFRNQVHHTLFSLPDEQDPPETVFEMGYLTPGDVSVTHELYLTCRLAAKLYATHVTFPVPRSALLRAIILPPLASKLDRITQTISSPLTLWCATVAAIAAEETPENCQLTEHVQGLCQQLKITSYKSFINILQSFAWVEVACSEGCYRLWKRLAVNGSGDRL